MIDRYRVVDSHQGIGGLFAPALKSRQRFAQQQIENIRALGQIRGIGLIGEAVSANQRGWLGGQGLGARLYFLCWEELCHRYGCPDKQMPFFVLAHTSTGPTALWTFASDSLKRQMLPRLNAGEVQGNLLSSTTGDVPGATSSLTKALGLAESVPDSARTAALRRPSMTP